MRVIICSFLFVLFLSAQANDLPARHVKNPAAENEHADKKSSKLYSRHIYFKLPLQQPRFHWQFLEKNKFFEGELKLIITTSEQRKIEIPVFKDGVLSENWMPLSKAMYPNAVYFGFYSQKQYLVTEMDKVQIILKNKNDLKGIGADFKGILKAGTYTSTNQFTLYHLEEHTGEKDRYAFLGKDQWLTLWTMEKTSDQGWLANRYDNNSRESLEDDKKSYRVELEFDDGDKTSLSVVNHKKKVYFFEHFKNHQDLISFITNNSQNFPDSIYVTTFKSKIDEAFLKKCAALQKKITIKLEVNKDKKLGETFFGDNDNINYYHKYKRK